MITNENDECRMSGPLASLSEQTYRQHSETFLAELLLHSNECNESETIFKDVFIVKDINHTDMSNLTLISSF